MDFSKKTKKVAVRVIGDFKDEVLGEREKKTSQPAQPKRSTIDVILGNFPKEEPMNPIVEAMLQTKESEETAKKSQATPDELDREMAQRRQERQKAENQWSENQTKIMAPPKDESPSGPLLPKSPQKGPGTQGNKAKGIESFKRGKKN